MSIDRATIIHLRHELRTPLNNIIGYSEMLLEDLADGDPIALEPGLRKVHHDAQELLAIINAFLGQSTREAERVDLGPLSVEVTGPIDSVVATVEALKVSAARAGAETTCQDLDRIELAAVTLRRLVDGGGALPERSSMAISEALLRTASAHEQLPGAGVILVVDDNATNRDMLGRRLAREGHKVCLAASGSEALDLMRQQNVDLVLLDVMMPEVDGYQVLQQLKAAPEFQNIPVLMISALDELESVVKCIELGAEDYLPKPFDPILLRARIGACLEKKHLRDREANHLRELAEWNQKLEQRVAEQVALVDRLGRLKRFFSPQLAELIVAGGAEDPLKTHRREITVCFVDLRGFTAFAETADPEEVMAVLREYHGAMGALILAHEGTLERFTGDGIMVFFNDPASLPDPAARAVRMVLEMRDQLAELTANWHNQGFDLGFGAGIAQGYATIGAIGFEGRWDYGAIGTVTNLAARLCGEAKPGQILVSRRVLTMVERLVDAELVGELTLKGFLKSVTTFNVLRVKDAAH